MKSCATLSGGCTTLTTSVGCSAGDCQFYDVPNSPDYSHVGPVTCDHYCDGTTRYYNGDEGIQGGWVLKKYE